MKILAVDERRCTGCRTCELVCSVRHERAADPARARIQVVKWEDKGVYLPMVCHQCEDAPCAAVCPVNAIGRDEELGRVKTDHDLCIGCRACVSACPFGVLGFHEERGKTLRCDLCHGNPTCVTFCETRALRYEEPDRVIAERRRQAAARLRQLHPLQGAHPWPSP